MDSLLHQIYDNGGKMVFCGDNTWVKMFPEMFHRKLENQDSLFVNDFYEGDQNITKKLSVELKRNDWEMLILHFLGLDHIGHVEGPFSPKVPGKLREMDTVIMHIHLALQHWVQSTNQSSLFIITGDHGNTISKSFKFFAFFSNVLNRRMFDCSTSQACETVAVMVVALCQK